MEEPVIIIDLMKLIEQVERKVIIELRALLSYGATCAEKGANKEKNPSPMELALKVYAIIEKQGFVEFITPTIKRKDNEN